MNRMGTFPIAELARMPLSNTLRLSLGKSSWPSKDLGRRGLELQFQDVDPAFREVLHGGW